MAFVSFFPALLLLVNCFSTTIALEASEEVEIGSGLKPEGLKPEKNTNKKCTNRNHGWYQDDFCERHKKGKCSRDESFFNGCTASCEDIDKCDRCHATEEGKESKCAEFNDKSRYNAGVESRKRFCQSLYYCRWGTRSLVEKFRAETCYLPSSNKYCAGEYGLGKPEEKTLEECQDACNVNLLCKNFIWSTDNGGDCRLSATCTSEETNKEKSTWQSYFRAPCSAVNAMVIAEVGDLNTNGCEEYLNADECERFAESQHSSKGFLKPGSWTYHPKGCFWRSTDDYLFFNNGDGGTNSISRPVCKKLLKPVNCVMSAWTASGSCSVTCGVGTQKMTRSVTTTPKNGGIACGPDVMDEPCMMGACNPSNNRPLRGNCYGPSSNRYCYGEYGLRQLVGVNIATCKDKCNRESTCTNFIWRATNVPNVGDGDCRLSETCTSRETNQQNSAWNSYFKTSCSAEQCYETSSRYCSGAYGLKKMTGVNLEKCKDACNQDSSCIHFLWRTHDGGDCRLSDWCTSGETNRQNAVWKAHFKISCSGAESAVSENARLKQVNKNLKKALHFALESF